MKRKKKTKRVINKKLWLSTEENKALVEHAKARGETVAGYLRRLGLDDPAPPLREDQEFRKELLRLLAGGLNNLNQLARATNRGDCDLTDIKDLQSLFKETFSRVTSL